MSSPESRLGEISKQAGIVAEQIEDQDLDVPPGLVDEVRDLDDRAERIRDALGRHRSEGRVER